MVISRGEMKRKRKEENSSSILNDSPKRTKVHAQRKFAQGSNVNSPVITPVKEIEKQEIDVMPEPVELLPIKRPNTEDFLTFLCFRGTPILPPNLNFFNTASLVDTNGQVHGLKSESPKNGPIDTSAITKVSGSSDKPFVAFGVRKRADPIVISRHMDKKRRHALALQALRRKYQEQRMAKIRAVTISKLSEKVTNKTMLKSSTLAKNEKNTIQKTKVVATKHVKVTTRTVKTALRPQIKQKMCLRSFRGRFVQKELQFRNVKKRTLSETKPTNKIEEKQADENDDDDSESSSEYSSDDNEPLSKEITVTPKVILSKVAKKTAPGPKKPSEINFRITRSNKFPNKITARRQQIKQRMILSTPTKPIVKPRTLRSQVKLPEKKIVQTIKESTQRKITSKKEITKPLETKKQLTNIKKELIREVKKSSILKKVPKPPVTLKKKIQPKPPIQEPENKVKKEINKKSPVPTKKPSEIKGKSPEKKDVKTSESSQEKKEESPKKITRNADTTTSQRPTRKTKEAAAIYMEILSHKLVNDSKIDDDNVSIDSFPELPNVKRTEQRENELKAKAKSNKGSTDKKANALKSKTQKNPPNEVNSSETSEESTEETEIQEKTVVRDESEKEKKRNLKTTAKPDEDSKKSKIKEEQKNPKLSTNKQNNNSPDKEDIESKKSANKRKLIKSDSDESNESNKIKTRKSDDAKKVIKTPNETDSMRRQTRYSSQTLKQVDSDSDESFHVDIKISRKKPITRSKVAKTGKDDELPSKNSKLYTELNSSSESDQSTTSDVNIKIAPSNKPKRLTKTRSKVSDQSFSDSDEEPLSKLTQNKTNTEIKSKDEEEKIESKKANSVCTTENSKPKRECAKRPQNYLPMFSSSDDEEQFFHSFILKAETKIKTQKTPIEADCPLVASDFSCKDIGRRFGKGKVNMSNEQIEKWLKDSAMAGSSIRKENDEMLKFGEKIPTETSFNLTNTIDTQKLKSALLDDVTKQENETEKKDLLDSVSPKADNVDKTQNKIVAKPTTIDRKFIFRKDKISPTLPNANAFSANNESSVYAFGEENEDVMKTPFRRPSRRPSSTATSRSEDESSRCEDVVKSGQFRKPPTMNIIKAEEKENTETEDSDHCFGMPLPKATGPSPKNKRNDEKSSTSMIPPKSKMMDLKKVGTRSVDRCSETSEEFKYKIPSSPSASSSSSAKLYKRQTIKPKFRTTEVFPITVTDFPVDGTAQLVEAPTFHPTEKEFQDPLEYIEKIRARAEQFGICRIVPPSTFKPECKVTDDMRFTAYNQYVHKMLHRWGPNFKELMAIKKYLSTQNISLTHPPWIGGMEIDLPRLYQTVQSLGGLKEVIEKKKWPKVSDTMKIPKSAQDRVTKLDDIYCKYLLPYDTLSPSEREKLFDEVETEWAKRESKSLLKAQQNVDELNDEESESDDEAEECIVKGRNMALNAFYRIARNTMSMWFKTSEPSAQDVEQEFWRHVTLKQNHICVHSGSIDSGNWGYGFAISKNSPFARHAWNLKVLTNNSGSVLRSLGPIMGVTVPTLHVGMVFSACCWYRDPHSLPWIEYLHTGGSKIWYGIPDSTSGLFHSTLKTLVPNYCRNKALWLPSDTAMVPPNILIENGVSLSRVVQEPGQFIIVFPKVYTSSLSTGYVVSESVYFAPLYWLNAARDVFDELRNSCEPSMFSLDRLLLSIVSDTRSSVDVLRQIVPAIQEICDKELSERRKIKEMGVCAIEKLPLPDAPNKKKKKQQEEGDYECEICRMNLFVSMISESQDDGIYCLKHAIEEIDKQKILSNNCKLMYTYDDQELAGLIDKINIAIANKLQKKIPNRYAGMPTLLTK